MILNQGSNPPIGVHCEIHDDYSSQQEYPHDKLFLFGVTILRNAVNLCLGLDPRKTLTLLQFYLTWCVLFGELFELCLDQRHLIVHFY
jgi:hypothetical protein